MSLSSPPWSVYCYRQNSQPSERDISPAPPGKEGAAGGRGGGHSSGRFSQQIWKRWGVERLLRAAGWTFFSWFSSAPFSVFVFFFIFLTDRKGREESWGCKTGHPPQCPFLYAPLVSSTSTHSLIVLAAGLQRKTCPPPVSEEGLCTCLILKGQFVWRPLGFLAWLLSRVQTQTTPETHDGIWLTRKWLSTVPCYRITF